MSEDSKRSPPVYWSIGEEKMLIQIFFDDKIQGMLDGTCRDKHVYEQIAARLMEAGFCRSATECKNKINNLKTWFKKHHKRPGKRGGAHKNRSEIYTLLDKFMSEKPSDVKPKHLFESENTGDEG